MYRLINEYATDIVATINPSHVSKYDWLRETQDALDRPEYEERYRDFWRMNAARLSPEFCETYFAELREAFQHVPNVAHLTQRLYETPTHNNGRQSLQFSYATKLLHMAKPCVPIYDSLIARFFFLEPPPRTQPLEQRIRTLVAFHDFLVQEYARILKEILLAKAILAFRERLKPQKFTDEKCIDSLIWASVAFFKKGGLWQGTVRYR